MTRRTPGPAAAAEYVRRSIKFAWFAGQTRYGTHPAEDPPGPQATGVADKAHSGAQSIDEQNKRLIYMIILGLHQIGPDGVLRELFPT